MSSANSNSERLWTPANIVTLLRICLIPVFVIAIISPWPLWFPAWVEADALKPWIAAGVFIALAATDALDGYLARSRGEVTNLGKFMDPLADKILVAAALLALIELGVLPSWVALIILTREFIVSGIRMVAASQGVVIAASWYGKAKTVTQMIAIVLFIVKDSHQLTSISAVLSDSLYIVSWIMMIIALALTIISMLDYFAKASELLGFTSKSSQGSGSSSESAKSIEAFENDLAVSSSDLARRVIDHAREAELTIGCAESCTGGLISGALTSIPGSSDVVDGGVVSYVNRVKSEVLGVRALTLKNSGAVSEETACQMAQGARKRLSCDVAVSVTGIAGPGGGTPEKPVGTVWIGYSDSVITLAKVFHFTGDRSQIRLQTVHEALCMLDEGITYRFKGNDLQGIGRPAVGYS